MEKEFRENLQSILSEFSFTSKNILHGIKYLLENDLWQIRDPSPDRLRIRTFKNFGVFCEYESPFGLNTMFKYVYDLCKRDRDILDLIDEATNQKVITSELSVNAAMFEAGFRKKKVQLVLGDIEKIAKSLIRNLSKEELVFFEKVDMIKKEDSTNSNKRNTNMFYHSHFH